MNKPLIATLGFLTAQILLFLAGQRHDIILFEEVLFLTLLIGVPMIIFFRGVRWMRWVIGLLVGFFAFMMLALGIDELGGSAFLGIGLLYILVIYLVFTHKPVSQIEKPLNDHSEHEGVSVDVKSIVEKVQVQESDLNDSRYQYPLLLRRYQSMFIDVIIFFAVMIITMVALGDSDMRQNVMIGLAALFLFVYEPVLTAYKATCGQFIMGIRVRQVQDPEQRIRLINAYVRIVVKSFLGWLSFLTINFDPKHRAIHDLASSSVVIMMKNS